MLEDFSILPGRWRQFQIRSLLPVAHFFVAAAFAIVPLAQAQKDTDQKLRAESQTLYAEALKLQQMNRLAEAQSTLLKAHTLSPGIPQIEIALGKLDSMLGKNDEAIAIFRDLHARRPGNVESSMDLAIALASSGKYDEALLLATAATRLRPDATAAHYLRGKVLVDMDRPQDARPEFERALALSPENVPTLYALALLCDSTGQTTEEIALLKHLTSVRPDVPTYQLLLGRTLAHSGDQKGAEIAFRKTVELDPNNRSALYSLSRLLQKDNPSDAHEIAERFRALRLTDDEQNSIRDQGNHGVQAMQQRNWSSAIATFQSALVLCSGCALEATLEKDLGLAQCQSGDPLSGLASLRRSFAINPTDPDVLQAIHMAEQQIPAPKP